MADAQAQLVCVVEPNASRAQEAIARMAAAMLPPCPVVSCLDDVTMEVDAAIIATPTVSHLELTLACVRRGWHVLVEKPIAVDASQAKDMIRAAHAQGVVLQVGHLERFNPAVEAALEVAGPVRYLVAERLGPFSGRATDVDVVLDLMIHDLDLFVAFADAPVHEVRAVGMPVLTDTIDMATARITLANGAVAQLSAGRTSLRPSRKLRLFTETGYLSIDCAAKTVSMVRRQGLARDLAISATGLAVAQTDALAQQDGAFFAAIAHGAPVRVNGEAGLRALLLAQQVKEAMAHHAHTYGFNSGVSPELLQQTLTGSSIAQRAVTHLSRHA